MYYWQHPLHHTIRRIPVIYPYLGTDQSWSWHYFVVIDWADRYYGDSWRNMLGYPEAAIFETRSEFSPMYNGNFIPDDEEVVYGEIKGIPVLVHHLELIDI